MEVMLQEEMFGSRDGGIVILLKRRQWSRKKRELLASRRKPTSKTPLAIKKLECFQLKDKSGIVAKGKALISEVPARRGVCVEVVRGESTDIV
jgi:hypothetical protein